MQKMLDELFAQVIRTEPTQKRSEERIDSLLDAAGAAIDERGITKLTTTDLARRAGCSVGVVYRYFPNMDALLQGLAARNMRRYVLLLEAALPPNREDWLASVDYALDVYVTMLRREPGFREVMFGDFFGGRGLDPDVKKPPFLAQMFAEMLRKHYGFEPCGDLLFALDVSVEIAAAMLRRAVQIDPNGDERLIEKTRGMVIVELSSVGEPTVDAHPVSDPAAEPVAGHVLAA